MFVSQTAKLDFMAIDYTDKKSVYLYGTCPCCKDKFFYRTRGILSALTDKALFEISFQSHIRECLNNRITIFIKEIQ